MYCTVCAFLDETTVGEKVGITVGEKVGGERSSCLESFFFVLVIFVEDISLIVLFWFLKLSAF